MCTRSISFGLMVLSVLLMAASGIADLRGKEHVLGISTHHMWADGIYLLVLSGWVVLWGHTSGPARAPRTS